MEMRYGANGRRMWNQEVLARIAYLAEAVALDKEQIFIGNALWSKAAFIVREMSTADLVKNLQCMTSVFVEQLPKVISDLTTPIIAHAVETLLNNQTCVLSPMSIVGTSRDLARMYLMHLLRRDRSEAERFILDLSKNGLTFSQICEGIFSPAMAEIGYMWQVQEASIADEHYCTNATQQILEVLRSKTPRKAPNGYLVVATCIGGDLHDLGIRILSAIYETEGWSVECLGANTPAEEIANTIAPQLYRGAADLLALSATTSLRIRSVQSVIAAVRATPAGKSIPILVGGQPFQLMDDLWQVVGANAQCVTSSASLETALRLVIESHSKNRKAHRAH
jgi:methanogenic corrinoid protein MtbC1